jgi:hypothetical protein
MPGGQPLEIAIRPSTHEPVAVRETGAQKALRRRLIRVDRQERQALEHVEATFPMLQFVEHGAQPLGRSPQVGHRNPGLEMALEEARRGHPTQRSHQIDQHQRQFRVVAVHFVDTPKRFDRLLVPGFDIGFQAHRSAPCIPPYHAVALMSGMKLKKISGNYAAEKTGEKDRTS